MTQPSAVSLLASAIPGHEIQSGKKFDKLSERVPQAWKFWRGKGAEWAAFVVVGSHMSEADQAGVNAAMDAGVKPVFVAPSYGTVKTISTHYRKLRPYLIFEIGGTACLIPPLNLPNAPPHPKVKSATRIPPSLIDEMATDSRVPAGLVDSLKKLGFQYKRLIRKGGQNDGREQEILGDHARRVLQSMGLRPEGISATEMIRTLEQGGYGANRDHFFHSFQNYFLGLKAIAELRERFTECQALAKLHWEVDPFDVWFLAVMWHDVGYAIQLFDRYYDAAFGHEESDDAARKLKLRFLGRSKTREALRVLSSLLARLLRPEVAGTTWMEPRPNANLGTLASCVHSAMCKNASHSHGAVGALRLFCDFYDDLDHLEPSRREVLTQTVLLACCSIPFHDFHFRTHLRESSGSCRIATQTMPFASLLAFIDSIQDDRRDLEGVQDAVLVLEELVIQPPAKVVAEINADALDDSTLLDKILESRDVLAALQQSDSDLFFKYPEWMAGQT